MSNQEPSSTGDKAFLAQAMAKLGDSARGAAHNMKRLQRAIPSSSGPADFDRPPTRNATKAPHRRNDKRRRRRAQKAARKTMRANRKH